MAEVSEAFGVPRRTTFSEFEGEIDDEALIPREDMVVTVTHVGYVKRTPLALYRTQRRGGKGRAGMQTKEEDFVTRVFVASTHAPILFFSSAGMVYKMKAWRLPQGDPRSRGRALVNILPLEQGETITSVMALPEDERDWEKLDVMFATRSGSVRRNKLSDFVQVNRNGKIAMKPEEGDGIVGVQICSEDDDVLLTTRGACACASVTDVRVFAGRTSTGNRGIDLAEGDSVISMSILSHMDVSAEERMAYLKRANAVRRGDGEGWRRLRPMPKRQWRSTIELGEQRYVEMSAADSSFDGVGDAATASGRRLTSTGSPTAAAKASSPWRSGKARRAPRRSRRRSAAGRVVPGGRGRSDHAGHRRAAAIRSPGEWHPHRRSLDAGVIVFNTADDEKVVSVERIGEEGEPENGG